MNREEMLLMQAAEECVEVAQRLSKANRFGMQQIQPGQTLTNRERIIEEYRHLRAVLGMCGIDAWELSDESDAAETAKVAKVEKYLAFSATCGRLSDQEGGEHPIDDQ